MSSYTLQAEIESKRPTELIKKETRTHGRKSAHTPRQKKKGREVGCCRKLENSLPLLQKKEEEATSAFYPKGKAPLQSLLTIGRS